MKLSEYFLSLSLYPWQSLFWFLKNLPSDVFSVFVFYFLKRKETILGCKFLKQPWIFVNLTLYTCFQMTILSNFISFLAASITSNYLLSIQTCQHLE